MGYSPWGHQETDMTEQLSTHKETYTNMHTLLKKKKNPDFLVAQMVKHLTTMQETQDRSLGWEDSLEKAMATHFSTLAWKIPWTEEPGRLHGVAESDTTEQLHFLSLS